MTKHTIFAYAQGTDLGGVAETIETRLDQLVAERMWALGDVWVVNQRFPLDANAKPGAVPDWDLGLNLTLPAGRSRPATWVEDVVAIASAFGALHKETGRKFVLGLADAKAETTSDLVVIDSENPDLDKVKAAFTAAAP